MEYARVGSEKKTKRLSVDDIHRRRTERVRDFVDKAFEEAAQRVLLGKEQPQASSGEAMSECMRHNRICFFLATAAVDEIPVKDALETRRLYQLNLRNKCADLVFWVRPTVDVEVVKLVLLVQDACTKTTKTMGSVVIYPQCERGQRLLLCEDGMPLFPLLHWAVQPVLQFYCKQEPRENFEVMFGTVPTRIRHHCGRLGVTMRRVLRSRAIENLDRARGLPPTVTCIERQVLEFSMGSAVIKTDVIDTPPIPRSELRIPERDVCDGKGPNSESDDTPVQHDRGKRERFLRIASDMQEAKRRRLL